MCGYKQYRIPTWLNSQLKIRGVVVEMCTENVQKYFVVAQSELVLFFQIICIA